MARYLITAQVILHSDDPIPVEKACDGSGVAFVIDGEVWHPQICLENGASADQSGFRLTFTTDEFASLGLEIIGYEDQTGIETITEESE